MRPKVNENMVWYDMILLLHKHTYFGTSVISLIFQVSSLAKSNGAWQLCKNIAKWGILLGLQVKLTLKVGLENFSKH